MKQAEMPGSVPASGLVNALTNVLGLTVPLLAFLFAAPVLVSELGTANFGVIMLFVSAVFLACSLDFGLGTAGLRLLGQSLHGDDGQRQFRDVFRQLWSALVLLGIALAGAMFVFVDTLAALASLANGSRGGVLSAAIFFGVITTALVAVPKAMELFAGLTAIQVVTGSLNWLGALLWVRAGFGVDAILWWFAVISGLGASLLAWWAARLAGGLQWMPVFQFGRLRPSMGYGFHSFAGQAAAMTTYQVDKFLVSHYLGTAAVGVYGLAASLSFRLLTLVAALSGFVFPRTVRMFSHGDMESLRDVYVRATRYVLLVSWPVFVVAWFLSKPFLQLWVGETLAATAEAPLSILMAAYFVASLSVVASQVFAGLGNARIGAGFSLLGMALNLVACVVMIPRWGLAGAALASLLAVCQVFGYTALLHQRLGISPWPFAALWARLFVAAIFPALLLWSAADWAGGWLQLLLLGASGWTVFYLAWFALRLADAGDLEMLRRLYGLVFRNGGR